MSQNKKKKWDINIREEEMKLNHYLQMIIQLQIQIKIPKSLS